MTTQKFNKIVGPISWSMYNYNEKTIHFFGDYHIKNTESVNSKNEISMADLLINVAKSTVKKENKVNIFLEASHNESESEIQLVLDTDIMKTINLFSTSLTSKKEDSPYYPYVNFHSVDTRYELKDSSNVIGRGIFRVLKSLTNYIIENQERLICTLLFLKIVGELKLRPNILFDIAVDKNNGKTVLDVLCKRTGVPLENDWFKKGSNTHKIRHQLLNIDPEITKLIRDFFKVKYDTLINKIIDLSSDVIKNIHELDLLIGFIESSFMDIYLLARMFRCMKWDPKCNLFIVYVGNLHKDRYDEFFQNVLNTKIIEGCNISLNPMEILLSGNKLDQFVTSDQFDILFDFSSLD